MLARPALTTVKLLPGRITVAAAAITGTLGPGTLDDFRAGIGRVVA